MTKREMWKASYEEHYARALDALRKVQEAERGSKAENEAWNEYKAERRAANHALGVMRRCKI